MTVGAFLRARQCTAAADRPALHRCVAVSLSGGVDSMVIAHILRSARLGASAMLHGKWAYRVCNMAVAFDIIHMFAHRTIATACHRSSIHAPYFMRGRQARFGFRPQCGVCILRH